jgi:phosphoribosylformylglycinamidine synthase
VTLHITEFEGGNALGEFRVRQLLARLAQISDRITGLGARFVHLVATQQPAGAADTERLAALLTYGEPFRGQADGPLSGALRDNPVV